MQNTASKKTKTTLGRPVDTGKSEAILKAAREEFFNQGFVQSSIESIAARAGVSKVTVYNRFGTKEALFVAAVETECDSMRQNLQFADISSLDLREALIGFGIKMTAFLERDEIIRFERYLAVESENNPKIGRLFLDAGPRRMHRTLSDLLTKAADSGKLDIDDTMMAAEQLAGMIKGLSDLERRMGQASDGQNATRKRVTSAVDVFLNSYARQ
ncbi:TetR/AcrR family transcriptional regulator [Sphingorhabdus sp. Alg239-R122]|uniref:TetR/AcrR family transcriptional regulator n=1 Tax=Sphingorhabdus sp. Alg239-R122 TaxID=2305989 RepID=UPI0013DA5088|nr:TetR/AcrR family transcriptional regulator [Sphingorhabdus sp. Alg239-R122]